MLKKFWRIQPQSDIERGLSGQQCIKRSVDFINRLRPGHGLILADWDEESRLGNCRSFGIVLSVDGPNGTAEVEWRPTDTSLRPNPAGLRYWREEKGWLGFADSVVDRYMLHALFAEKFPDIEELTFGRATLAPISESASYATPTSGYVYLIKSDYGYKIGKSVNVKQRTQLFSVKLPFPIELIHYAHFDDYTVAERALHLRFDSKRLEGEWFNLSEDEIAYIRTQGDTVNVTES